MRDPRDNSTISMDISTLIGYARVATTEQSLDMQIEALKSAGCHRVFTDVASGAKADRPGLNRALDYLHEGDTLMVWKIDRIGHSIPHLVQVISSLSKRGVGFRSLTDAVIDTTTHNGKLIINIFAAIAEFEQDLIRERTKAGLTRAAARGRRGGRRPVVTPTKMARAQKLMQAEADGGKNFTVREAAAEINVSKTALYKALNLKKAEEGSSKQCDK